MKKILVTLLILVFVLTTAGLVYIVRTPSTAPPPSFRLPQRTLDMTVTSQHPQVNLRIHSADNFNQFAQQLALAKIDTLILSNRTIPIRGFQHVNFILIASPSAILHPDILSTINGVFSEAVEYEYHPQTKTIDILFAFAPEFIDQYLPSRKNDLELRINDGFLKGMYLMTYQRHEKEFSNYLAFLTAYDSIQTDLYVTERTFVAVVE